MLNHLPLRLDHTTLLDVLDQLALEMPPTARVLQAQGVRLGDIKRFGEAEIDKALQTNAPSLDVAGRLALKLAMSDAGLIGRR